jgi:hypothetical protein
MKKTIAKLMAAAMMLSAVPAVTLPSFVSKAADSAVSATSVSYAADLFTKKEDAVPAKKTVTIESHGLVARVALPTYVNVESSVADGALADQLNITYTKSTTASVNNANYTVYDIKAGLKSNLTSQQMSDLRTKILGGNNTFRILTNVSWDDTKGGWNAPQKGQLLSKEQFNFGGVITNGSVIENGVFDDSAFLNSGDVKAKIGNVSTTNKDERLIEVEIQQGVKGQLKNNDALRGNTLDLTTVWIGGNKYKVTKLGSQCLKEAHMKKLIAKNVTQVGKGALRKCKNVRKVNISDKNKVRKIRSKAFYDCKNLKHINIDARKLKEVGKDSFTKLKKGCVIRLKANKSKFNESVKKIKKANKKANKPKFVRNAP